MTVTYIGSAEYKVEVRDETIILSLKEVAEILYLLRNLGVNMEEATCRVAINDIF